MLTSFRLVCPGIESLKIALKPQAWCLRHPQQWTRNTVEALQLPGIADVIGHVYRVFPRGGEARSDVAGRSASWWSASFLHPGIREERAPGTVPHHRRAVGCLRARRTCAKRQNSLLTTTGHCVQPPLAVF